MSGAERQEGAGGALRVDGLQDGGRVNNTQLIALFSLFMPKKEEEKKTPNIVTEWPQIKLNCPEPAELPNTQASCTMRLSTVAIL